MKTPVVPFFISHRGCPHRCVFCDQERIAGTVSSLPSAADIREKIAEYRRLSGTHAVEAAFFGGSFTGLPRDEQERLLLPLQPLLASGELSSVRVSTRPDTIDDAGASLLQSLGVKTVELGVQSMDDRVLELSQRGHSAVDVEKAVLCLKRRGFSVGIQLMPGLPGDTPHKALSSLSRILDLGPDFLRVYPAVVIQGTPLARSYLEDTYRPLSLPAAVTLCKVMLHRSLSAGVPMIRMGLQPTAELEKEGTVVAGPFHPAFRQLVEAELFFDLLMKLVDARVPNSSPVTIRCAPSRVSDVIGQGRANIRRLLEDRGVRIAGVLGDSRLSSRDLAVDRFDGIRTGNILSDLHYTMEDATHA
jgi:histone acetyltransferase (RNA polymerase elongator complex component)